MKIELYREGGEWMATMHGKGLPTGFKDTENGELVRAHFCQNNPAAMVVFRVEAKNQ